MNVYYMCIVEYLFLYFNVKFLFVMYVYVVDWDKLNGG